MELDELIDFLQQARKMRDIKGMIGSVLMNCLFNDEYFLDEKWKEERIKWMHHVKETLESILKD